MFPPDPDPPYHWTLSIYRLSNYYGGPYLLLFTREPRQNALTPLRKSHSCVDRFFLPVLPPQFKTKFFPHTQTFKTWNRLQLFLFFFFFFLLPPFSPAPQMTPPLFFSSFCPLFSPLERVLLGALAAFFFFPQFPPSFSHPLSLGTYQPNLVELSDLWHFFSPLLSAPSFSHRGKLSLIYARGGRWR